jgi:hypothetical protein
MSSTPVNNQPIDPLIRDNQPKIRQKIALNPTKNVDANITAVTDVPDQSISPSSQAVFPTARVTISTTPIEEYGTSHSKKGLLKHLLHWGKTKTIELPPTPTMPPKETEVPTIKTKDPITDSPNGNPIIGKGAAINARPWWDSGYWKVGEDEGFREMEVDIGTAGELAVIGATLRGSKHRFQGGPNQDSYAILHDELVHSFLLVAVSDGVSNAKHSGYSSRKLVRHTVRAIALDLANEPERLWTGDELIQIADNAIARASANMRTWVAGDLDSPKIPPDQASVYDLSATLTLAIIPVNPTEDGSRTAIVGFVGDSPCYLLDSDGWSLKTPPTKQGDVMDQTTNALPLDENETLKTKWLDVKIPAGAALFVMTDGVSTALDSGNTTLGEYLREEWSAPSTMKHFTNVLDFDRQGEDDDRTVVAVWTRPFGMTVSDVQNA